VDVDAEGIVKVRVHAPPVDGEANEAAVRVLADALGLRRSELAIVSGTTGRMKVIEAEGLTADEAIERLRIASAPRQPRKRHERGAP
jgi:hypothetical protein